MAKDDPIERALKLPGGARFYRCALQVNPFEYLMRHHKQTRFSDEASYNQAMIAACQEHGIEVIAVTDHYRVESARGLLDAAHRAGIAAFPGFEAVTKDGIHLLCLFGPELDLHEVDRHIGDCGVTDRIAESPLGKYDVLDTLEKIQGARKAICVAAHVAAEGGLLKTLKGQPRIAAWIAQSLLACSLPGPVKDAPDDLRPILQNKDPNHRRERPMAVINAQDVNAPEDFAKTSTWSWLKMAEVSVEGLRQAFLDPDSRVRLNSDPVPEQHIELTAISWEAGFLDRQAIHWNENLNVLIGGRGTGKSTVVESLRYVFGLEPIGEDARKAHEGIVRQVLRSGTKITLLVQCYRPDKREYRIERTIPNPPVVRDSQGQVLNLSPRDVVPGIEIYGQHEISELARSPEKLTHLLARFIDHDPARAQRKQEVRRELKRSREQLLEIESEIEHIDDRLASLPNLEETLRIYQEAGLEERLKERSLLIREERIFKQIADRTALFRELLDQLRRELPIDRSFLSPTALAELPGRDLLAPANAVLDQLTRDLIAARELMAEAIERAARGIEGIRGSWEGRQSEVEREYQQILRELQKSRIDGVEFIRLRGQIEELRPLRERRTVLARDLKEVEQSRRNLLAEWQEAKGDEFRELQRASKKVSRKLAGRVRVQVTFTGEREPLFALLKEQVGGRLTESIEALRKRPELSIEEFTEALRQGRDETERKFALPRAQADRLASAGTKVILRIEELDLPATTRIELNVASHPEEREQWQALEDLSTGQKATAVLLLLLLESEAPLVVDQPEDDLDNRFITDGIVPRMREEKRRRQFIVSTHNANIPVLGDAELIIGLRAVGEAAGGQAEIPRELLGSMDSATVRAQVEEILEGGRAAFEMRRLKYGF